METTQAQIRQTMGCAYEPPPDEPLRPFVHIAVPAGCEVEPTVCAGYSTKLPEVIEAARARLHWSKGSLDHFCRGYATQQLLMAIEVHDAAINETQAWSIKNPQKKAGA